MSENLYSAFTVDWQFGCENANGNHFPLEFGKFCFTGFQLLDSLCMTHFPPCFSVCELLITHRVLKLPSDDKGVRHFPFMRWVQRAPFQSEDSRPSLWDIVSCLPSLHPFYFLCSNCFIFSVLCFVFSGSFPPISLRLPQLHLPTLLLILVLILSHI